jgi:hypothetical protein
LMNIGASKPVLGTRMTTAALAQGSDLAGNRGAWFASAMGAAPHPCCDICGSGSPARLVLKTFERPSNFSLTTH